MIYKHLNDLHLYSFDSFEEYLNRAAGPRLPLLSSGADLLSSWGTPAFAQHLHKARHGDPALVSSCDAIRNAIVADLSTQLPKPEPQYDYSGSYWDLDRVLSHDPECWVAYQPTQDPERGGRGNLVRFVINTAASFDSYTSAHAGRAGAILALVDLLEILNYSVQFEVSTAIKASKSDSRRVEFRTITKRAHQKASSAQLAYWTSEHMEREIDFAICETVPELSHSHKRADVGHVSSVHDRGDICFDGMTRFECNWENPAEVLDYVKRTLIKQGIRFPETPATKAA